MIIDSFDVLLWARVPTLSSIFTGDATTELRFRALGKRVAAHP